MYSVTNVLKGTLKVLRANEKLLELLGATGDTEKYMRIVGGRNYYDLTGSQPRLCVYFRPEQMLPVDNQLRQVVEVCAHAPESSDMLAYSIIERVKDVLCSDSLYITNRQFVYGGMMGEMATREGYFAVAARFYIYKTI